MALVAAPAGETTVTGGTTLLIHRLLALFCPGNLLPALELMRQQLPLYATWWLVVLLPWGAASLGLMLVRAARRRSIAAAAGSYALFALAAVVTSPLAAGATSAGSRSWLWWVAGPAVVCAAVWRGLAAAVVHAVLLAVSWGAVTTLPQLGASSPRTAWSDAAALPVLTLGIAVTAVGMLRAGGAADAVARRLYTDHLEQSLSRTLTAERAQLDRLIHDDVMTTLTSAAHARDAATTEATRRLARQTLAKISALQQHQLPPGGGIDLAALLQLVAQTSEHVSPAVSFVSRVPADAALELPVPVAEALVGAVREAARNAVRHAQASRIEVTADLRADPDRGDLLALEVRDDGIGFDVDQVTQTRFGVQHSILERLRQAGVKPVVQSSPLAGTRVSMVSPLRPRRPPVAGEERLDEQVGDLPADFPTRQLLAVFWVGVVVQIGLGLVNSGVTRLAPDVVAMVAVLGVAALVAGGAGLRLTRGRAVAAVALLVTGVTLASVAMPRDRWPEEAFWYLFPLELVLVVLVVRLRLPYAVIAWALTGVVFVVWCAHADFGWSGIATCLFGTTSFTAMAVAVRQVLRGIAHRQHDLRRREAAALDELVRRYVARIQRALWVEDLQESVRDVLRAVAATPGPVEDGLRQECLLVEAKLRESLVARNVMTEELAATTEAARRRGVTVTFVDSRRSEVGQEVGRAVLREVRTAVAGPDVERVVVRLAPNGMPSSATVFTTGASGSNLTSIGADGVSTSEEVGRG